MRMKVNRFDLRNAVFKISFLGLVFNTFIASSTSKIGAEVILKAKVQEALVKEIIVSGRVVDAEGAPLPGVSVQVKGTNNGAVTDLDGRYRLSNVPENAILVFSFISMKTQEIAVGGKTTIDVTMTTDAVNMQEVVVVGYGSVKKSDLTGSVGVVSAERIQERGTTSVMEALQGNVAGVDIQQSSAKPGSGFNIQIRGQNSIAGGNPLY